MSTSFPTGLDTFTNPNAGDAPTSPAHHTQHTNANDAIAALEAKVGVDGSAVATSLDYKIAHIAGTNVGQGALSARPSPSGAGKLYYANDSIYDVYLDSGAAWIPVKGGYQCTEPPSFTNGNLGSVNKTTSHGGLVLDAPADAGVNLHYFYKAIPVATDGTHTWSMTTLLRVSHYANLTGAGLVIYDSGNTKWCTWTVGGNGSPLVYRDHWTGTSTRGNDSIPQTNLLFSHLIWLRVRWDKTNLQFDVSYDGQVWMNLDTASVAAAGLTAPDNYGVFMFSNSNQKYMAEFYDFTETNGT